MVPINSDHIPVGSIRLVQMDEWSEAQRGFNSVQQRVEARSQILQWTKHYMHFSSST